MLMEPMKDPIEGSRVSVEVRDFPGRLPWENREILDIKHQRVGDHESRARNAQFLEICLGCGD